MTTPLENWIRQHAAGERALAKVLRKYFRDQIKRIQAALTSVSAKAFNAAKEHELLMEAVSEPIVGMIATGAYNVLQQVPKTKKEFDASVLNDFELPENVKDEVGRVFGEIEKQPYWQEIQAGTESKLSEILKAGIEEGLSISNLSDRIGEELELISSSRAKAIARTEATRAYNAGHQLSYTELGSLISGKQWLSVLDNDTRETHYDLNGTIVEPDGEFTVGNYKAQYPGDMTLGPEECVNCRCTTIAVFNRGHDDSD